MMQQTGSWNCFPFLFLLCMLPLNPILAYILKNCTVVYSENANAGVSVECEHRQLVIIPDDIPRDVISLTLQHNDIQDIHRADFYNLSNLVDLELSYNKIFNVDGGAFINLMELKVLRMFRNKLTTLSDDMFHGLSNLLILCLDFNKIQFINPAAFKLLPNLQTLSLHYNQIHQISDIITILQLPRLQVLNISIYDLLSFQSKELPLNLSSELRELRVISQSITKFSITTAVFPYLETVDLTCCCNKSGWEWDIPDKNFLRNITKAYFWDPYMYFNNTIKFLQSLDSLQYLQLSNMKKSLNRGLLTIACKIPTLSALNLRNNNIPNLSALTELSQCTQLSNLDLSHNFLTELSKDSIKHMKQLSRLNLTGNQLSKVPDDVKNLSMLQYLNLNDNHINDLSCLDFLNLTRLTHLHLDNNRISELKACVFLDLNELKVLTMNDNLLWMFDNMFSIGLQKLEFLNLRNPIEFLGKGDFNGLKSLKHLNVESDKVVGMDGTAFEGLDELETLSLIFNVVEIKPTSLLPHVQLPLLKSLKSLKIQSNAQIISPCNTLKNTPQLEALDLSKYKLKSLDFLAQANLTRVSWLDLSENELTVINVSVFHFLPALSYVNMADNPFACD